VYGTRQLHITLAFISHAYGVRFSRSAR